MKIKWVKDISLLARENVGTTILLKDKHGRRLVARFVYSFYNMYWYLETSGSYYNYYHTSELCDAGFIAWCKIED